MLISTEFASRVLPSERVWHFCHFAPQITYKNRNGALDAMQLELPWQIMVARKSAGPGWTPPTV
jgi:hypothetical protein